MHDNLGDRIKKQYENRTRYFLPRRTYTIMRLDGKAFHTYTKSFKKPLDPVFISSMNVTARKLCEEIEGVCFAYVQSDEISLLLTDFNKCDTCAWFDGNIQKMTSVSASIASASFNGFIGTYCDQLKYAYFDSRVFTIPDKVEVENYFIWRQQDWTRNSIQMFARSLYSHKELHGKNCNELQELMWQKGLNWNDLASVEKRGRTVLYRNRWFVDENIPIFTQDREYIRNMIPDPGYEI